MVRFLFSFHSALAPDGKTNNLTRLSLVSKWAVARTLLSAKKET